MYTYTEADIRRFYSHIVVKGLDECWEWVGGTARHGCWHQMNAHRFAFWIATGIYPGALYVCHSCDNHPCCNPKHLFLGTQKDNMQDAAKKGRLSVPHRSSRGSSNHHAKLTENDVREIREKHTTGISQSQLGREYGISQVHIGYIVHRKVWKHI